MHSICIITDASNYQEFIDDTDDEEHLFINALRADDFFEVDIQSWDDPKVDWSRYKTAIIRATWDYTKSVNEFLHWTHKLKDFGVELINSADAIEWNSNKKYIFDLASSGVPTLPTVLVNDKSDRLFSLPSSNSGWIVKPIIGSTSKGVQKYDNNRADEAREYAFSLISSGLNALVQPFAEEIADGEVSFVFFGDQYSHACRKTPAKGDFRVQFAYGGRDRYFDATPEQIEQARSVLKVAPFDTLYSRVDMVEISGKFVLMELELIEPYLFFGYNRAPQLFIEVLKDHLNKH